MGSPLPGKFGYGASRYPERFRWLVVGKFSWPGGQKWEVVETCGQYGVGKQPFEVPKKPPQESRQSVLTAKVSVCFFCECEAHSGCRHSTTKGLGKWKKRFNRTQGRGPAGRGLALGGN